MIKKTISIIMLLFVFTILLSFNVKATSIIELPRQYVQIGIGDDTILEEPNLTIKSGFVNWQVEGNYTVTYTDRLDNIYKKTFIVLLDKEDQFHLSSYEAKAINFKNTNEIRDVFYISDTNYYVVSNYQEIDPTLPDQEKICITFYENHQYKWEYRYYKYARFKCAYLHENNLIVSGEVYNASNNYITSIVLFEITKDRQIIKSREIISNMSCYVFGLYYFENSIFLITSTPGNGYDYKNIKEDLVHRLVILKLNYINFKIEEGKVETQLDNFSIIDSSFYNTRLTINVLLKENKNVNGVIMSNCILEYNTDLEFIKKYYYDTHSKDYIGHQVTMKDVCYFYLDNITKDNCVKIQYLNNGVINKNIILDLENQSTINNIEVVTVNRDDIYLCLKNGINKDCKFLGFAKVNSENGLAYFTTTAENINVISSKISNGYIINTFKQNDNNIYYKNYNLLEITKKINILDDSIESKKTVVVNGSPTKRISYSNTVNKNIYGIYKNLNYTKDQFNNTYLLNDETFVFLDVNIENEDIYQTGLKLKFNGVGYLNGKEISSNYIINDIGKYLLEIVGENIENTLISFEISELTVTSNQSKQSVANIIFEDAKKEILLDESYVNTKCEFIIDKNYDNTIPLVISIVTFGILGLILLRKKI